MFVKQILQDHIQAFRSFPIAAGLRDRHGWADHVFESLEDLAIGLGTIPTLRR
jgi:hypothetical protein